MTNWIQPGKTIGIVGGGSVARLLAISAKKLGYKVGIIDPQPDCPARSLADWHIVEELTDEQACMNLAMKSDVVLYASDGFQPHLIRKMKRAVSFPQGEELLSVAQDRMLQKAFLESVRVNIAPFATIVTLDDIKQAVQSIGYPCVLKANNTDERFKDHHVLFSDEDIATAESFLSHGTCVLEAWIPSEKELCIAVVKDKDGTVSAFPVTEMKYKKDRFSQSIAPARIGLEVKQEISRIGHVIAENLAFTGVMAVEVFAAGSGALYVNEIVAHPHHAYRYTFSYAGLSQYDALIKTVAGWPVELSYFNLNPEYIVMQALTENAKSTAFTQAQIKPEWEFVFYENNSHKTGVNEIGHITIQTADIGKTLVQLSDIFE